MAKVAYNLDINLLRSIVARVDDMPIIGISKAWEKVAELFELEHQIYKSSTFFSQRAKIHNIGFVKIKAAPKPWELKQVNSYDLVQITELGPTPIEETYKRDKDACKQLIAYTKQIMPRYEKVAKSAARGSMKAAIKLQCLECCGFDKVEVRNCEIKHCPLWNFRPYK